MEQINKALRLLDPTEDDHWTSDGLPRMEAIHALTEDASITRKMVTDADPNLTRETAAEIVAPTSAPLFDGDEVETITLGDTSSTVTVVEGEPAVEDRSTASEPKADDEPVPEPVADDVYLMKLPRVQILRSPTLTARMLVVMEGLINKALGRRSDINAELQQLNAKNEILKRAATIQSRGKPSNLAAGVKAMQEASRRGREEKAARARRFVDAGVTTDDVLKQLQTKSPLDRALGVKRPGIGTQRPAVRVPSTMTS